MNFGGSNEPGVAQVRIKTVRDSLPAVLSLVTEALREPAFPKPEFETLRKELLARYEEQLQDPVRNGMTTLMQKVNPAPKTDVRYILSMAERIEALKKMTVADLSQLHKSLWGASATQVAVVGDFDPAAIKAQLEKELAPWKSPKPYARITQPFKPGLVEEATVNTPDKQMSLVAVGHPLEVRDDDPDYPTLVLLNHVLGGSASSRLLNRLRQKEGLSYGAFSDIDARAAGQERHLLRRGHLRPGERQQGDGPDAGGDHQAAEGGDLRRRSWPTPRRATPPTSTPCWPTTTSCRAS